MTPPPPSRPVRRPGPGTPVTVVGLARSGAAASRWLLELGCVVRATEASRTPALESAAQGLTDSGAAVELGIHTRGFIEGSELLVVSPGVGLTAPPVRWANQMQIPVVSEMELGSWYCPGKLVAVTGSNGKSTVVTLLGEILKAAGQEAAVCGNIGFPLTGFLDRIGPSRVVVLEVSSFQLETSLSFHTGLACLLNVTDNHLDRHQTFAQYQAAKARLFRHQDRTAFALLNRDDPGSWSLRSSVRGKIVAFSRRHAVTGAAVEGDWLTLKLPHLSGRICRKDALPKSGKHHEENALAAACLAGLLGVEPQISGGVLQSFQGLPHRQEVVAQVRGVTFVNDSKSTTVASGMTAIESLPGKVILIAGGRDKGSDFRKLRPLVRKLKAAVLFGEDAPKIHTHLKGTVPLFKAVDLKEAVETAFQMAEQGEWVLLSPMCTSFDMFQNFEERGERFVEAVKELACWVH